MTTNAKPRNPRTPAEWQEAADGAQVMLLVDAARQYGLIEGGPEVDQERCVEILRLAKRRGITPREDCVERAFRPADEDFEQGANDDGNRKGV
jgi:hypothetical protein